MEQLMNTILILMLSMLPWGIFGFYLLMTPSDKGIFEQIHKIMKSGRINKVAKHFLG